MAIGNIGSSDVEPITQIMNMWDKNGRGYCWRNDVGPGVALAAITALPAMSEYRREDERRTGGSRRYVPAVEQALLWAEPINRPEPRYRSG